MWHKYIVIPLKNLAASISKNIGFVCQCKIIMNLFIIPMIHLSK